MNPLDLFRARRTTCRHPSVCDATPGRNELMCPAHAADEALPANPHNRLETWDLQRRNSGWPINKDRVGWPQSDPNKQGELSL